MTLKLKSCRPSYQTAAGPTPFAPAILLRGRAQGLSTCPRPCGHHSHSARASAQECLNILNIPLQAKTCKTKLNSQLGDRIKAGEVQIQTCNTVLLALTSFSPLNAQAPGPQSPGRLGNRRFAQLAYFPSQTGLSGEDQTGLSEQQISRTLSWFPDPAGSFLFVSLLSLGPMRAGCSCALPCGLPRVHTRPWPREKDPLSMVLKVFRLTANTPLAY